eukprot:s945_g14.t1
MGKDKRNSHGQRIRREERQSKRDQDQQLDSKAICKACVVADEDAQVLQLKSDSARFVESIMAEVVAAGHYPSTDISRFVDFEVIVHASITLVVWQIFHGHQRFSKVDLLRSTADACEVHRVYFTLHKSPKSPKSQIFHGHQRFSKVDLLRSTADACEVHRVYFTLHKSPKSPKSPKSSPGRHRVVHLAEAEADARHEIKWSQSEEDITLRVLVDAETIPTQWDAV